MSNVKTTMIELRAVLQALGNGESKRKIERDLRLSRTSIKAYEQRALESGYSYDELLLKDDGELNAILRRDGGHRWDREQAFPVPGRTFEKIVVPLQNNHKYGLRPSSC